MSENKDQKWVEKEVLQGKDILFYGTLAEDFSNIPPEEFWKEFRTQLENYLKTPNNRSDIFHQLIDQKLEELIARDKRYGYPPPYCHKGCANCCHEIVYCTSEEAELILKYCQENKIEIDYQKIERQLKTVEFDDEGNHSGITTWNDQSEEDQACIFLNPQEKSCKIWAVRPFVCRVHLAEETDLYCRPYNGDPHPQAKGISYPEWSYILSAIFTIHQDSIKKTMVQLLSKFKTV